MPGAAGICHYLSRVPGERVIPHGGDEAVRIGHAGWRVAERVTGKARRQRRERRTRLGGLRHRRKVVGPRIERRGVDGRTPFRQLRLCQTVEPVILVEGDVDDAVLLRRIAEHVAKTRTQHRGARQHPAAVGLVGDLAIAQGIDQGQLDRPEWQEMCPQ